MIIADTSVWIDHIKGEAPEMRRQLENRRIATHSFVIGELALGPLRNRAKVLADLDLLPQVQAAQSREVRSMIESRDLYNRGIGWIDAHLLAAVLLNHGTKLWSRDKPLRRIAEELGIHVTFK